MQAPRLIFHPKQPELIVEPKALVTALTDIGLLGGARASDDTGSYYAGEHFLELLTFLGCSPVIALSPDEGARYCYIDIETYAAPQFIYGSQPFQPRCKHCRSPIADWLAQYTGQAEANEANIHCARCGEDSSLHELNWKHSAGVGRQLIIIHNIYLHEAVPGDKLLQTLETLSPGSAWEYFYAI